MNDYCKTCKHDDDIGFCDKCFYNRALEEGGIPPTMYEAKPKPQTNADRIRAMTDEELADRIMCFVRCEACEREFHIECNPLMTCRGVWLEWLKSPVEVDK